MYNPLLYVTHPRRRHVKADLHLNTSNHFVLINITLHYTSRSQFQSLHISILLLRRRRQ